MQGCNEYVTRSRRRVPVRGGITAAVALAAGAILARALRGPRRAATSPPPPSDAPAEPAPDPTPEQPPKQWLRWLPWVLAALIVIGAATWAAITLKIPDWARWTLAGIAIGVAACLILAVLIGPAARRLAGERHPLTDAERRQMTVNERVEAVNAARHTLIQAATGLVVIGGVVFTVQSLWYTVQTLETSREAQVLAEQGQITDRYTKAVEQLGSSKLDVRLGGIYALERLAQDSPRDHQTIYDVLAAFVREHDPAPSVKELPRHPTTDIQAALTVIGRRAHSRDTRVIDLSGARIRGAKLEGANLHRVNLRGANLAEVNLTGADLSGANLVEAHLSYAYLADTNLSNAGLDLAYLSNANLRGANLHGAGLAGANLRRANLDRANLRDAHIGGIFVATRRGGSMVSADLRHADLIGADLRGANLSPSDLRGANMMHANLRGATLTSANLSGADLRDANLMQADLDSANLSGANLTDVDLREANLSGANLEDVQGMTPEEISKVAIIDDNTKLYFG